MLPMQSRVNQDQHLVTFSEQELRIAPAMIIKGTRSAVCGDRSV